MLYLKVRIHVLDPAKTRMLTQDPLTATSQRLHAIARRGMSMYALAQFEQPWLIDDTHGWCARPATT
jgi:hypothetical protein